ncbi:MAG: ABC transporter ATP-binding protein [Clostridia bacterium]|nr:ABC transporter ATP-binding protein [Clostridia bacterium]
MKVFFRILKDAKSVRKYIVIGLIGMLVTTASQLAAPQFIRKLISLLTTDNSEDMLKKSFAYAGMLLGVYLLEFLFNYVKSYYSHLAAWNYVADIRVRVYDKLQKLSMSFYQDKQTGQLMSTAANDTRDLEELIAHAVPDAIVGALTFAGVLTILYTINAVLATFTLLTIPISAFLVSRFTKDVYPLFKKARQKQAEFYAILHDNLNGMKEIQTFNKQEYELNEVNRASEEHRDLNLRALKLSAFYHPAVAFVTNFGTVLIVGVGGYLASEGRIPVADIVAFMLYISKLYNPINILARLNETLQNTIACAERVFKLLDEEPDVKEKENALILKDIRGSIEFENVCFSYVDNINVLKNISFKINPGEMVAIVGHTGVGKTTISNLINRFYDADSGAIRIDGIDIRDVTLKSLRDNVSTVLQDVYLFNGTVRENIAYGCVGATFEEIVSAAKNANADEFICDMPNGYDTVVGERGLKLSGGQKQRISIARALLRNTKILILDEATASVDMETERLIHEAIDGLIKNRTTIIIAHRLASVKNADKIIVLDEKGIAETGTHQELMAKGGLYANLCKIQFTNH